jgi:hypothetical protein
MYRAISTLFLSISSRDQVSSGREEPAFARQDGETDVQQRVDVHDRVLEFGN